MKEYSQNLNLLYLMSTLFFSSPDSFLRSIYNTGAIVSVAGPQSIGKTAFIFHLLKSYSPKNILFVQHFEQTVLEKFEKLAKINKIAKAQTHFLPSENRVLEVLRKAMEQRPDAICIQNAENFIDPENFDLLKALQVPVFLEVRLPEKRKNIPIEKLVHPAVLRNTDIFCSVHRDNYFDPEATENELEINVHKNIFNARIEMFLVKYDPETWDMQDFS